MMRISRNFISLCLGGLAGVLLCAETPAGLAMARAPGALTVSEQDAGKTVSLKVGQALEVHLQGQPGTGAGWSVAPGSTNLLKYEGVKSAGGAAMPGGSETQILTFTATAAGTGDLKLEYGRPWEETVPPQKTFSLTVKIGAD
jgi:inhibitor of cysteine peptidase